MIFFRSFDELITDRTGPGFYAQQGSVRLHRHNKHAWGLNAWAMTIHYNQSQSHRPALMLKLPCPTSYPVVLTKAAKALLLQVLVGVKYARNGVVLTDLRRAAMQETFDPFVSAHEQKQIGNIVEQIRNEH
ncbi:hypothetical protein CIK76_11420 [Glutamicibacter sp. BW80]|nr:hypothetical protein CIK76_11420 [Glutamicibacter sp. BW80]